MTKKTRKQNKLHNSNSPYLLQHANNPVNWYPWSSEAFAVAADEASYDAAVATEPCNQG